MTQEEKAKAYDEALERIRKELQKCGYTGCDTARQIYRYFPELKESEDERIRKAIISGMKALQEKGLYTEFAHIPMDDVFAWLERQGEQNLADNVKPKFKVGDWICNDACDVHIASIEDGMYYFDEGDGLSIVFVDEHYHLWTIEDAMDGDVLTYKNDNVEWILIYKNIMSETCDVPHDVLKYHALFTGTVFYDSGSAGMISENYALCFTPSTKEQRELLFQKMKEAGYIFDFKNKELKKIETEIEIPFGAKDSELQEGTYYYIPDGFHAGIDNDSAVIKKGNKEDESWFKEIELMCLNFSNDTDYREEFFTWLESLKDRVGCEANCTTTKEWSDEDERNMQNIDSVLFYDRRLPEDTCVKLRNFLKTLKERIGWKPSEEQISSLRDVIYSLPHHPVLFTLYNDLKKLKGE